MVVVVPLFPLASHTIQRRLPLLSIQSNPIHVCERVLTIVLSSLLPSTSICNASNTQLREPRQSNHFLFVKPTSKSLLQLATKRRDAPRLARPRATTAALRVTSRATAPASPKRRAATSAVRRVTSCVSLYPAIDPPHLHLHYLLHPHFLRSPPNAVADGSG